MRDWKEENLIFLTFVFVASMQTLLNEVSWGAKNRVVVVEEMYSVTPKQHADKEKLAQALRALKDANASVAEEESTGHGGIEEKFERSSKEKVTLERSSGGEFFIISFVFF